MTRSHIAFLVLGVVVGASFGVLGGPSAEPETVAVDPGAGPQKGEAPPKVAAAEVDLAISAGAQAGGAAPLPLEQPEAASGPAAQGLGANLQARYGGSGRIWGTVIDDFGAGVPGVVIRVRPEVGSFEVLEASAIGAAAASLDDWNSQAMVRARALLEANASTHETTTDEVGRFSLTDLAQIRWELNASKPGMVVMPADRGSTPVVTGEKLQLRARACIAVPVMVRRADGSPLPSAVIMARPRIDGYQGARAVRWFQDAGNIPLEAGEWQLQAFAGNFRERPSERGRYDADLVSKSMIVQVPLGGAQQALELVVEEATGLFGRVVVEDGAIQPTRLTVKLAAYLSDARPSMDRTNRAVLSRTVPIGSSYAFQDLEPGKYLIAVSPGSLETAIHEESLEVVRGRNDHHLMVPGQDRSKFVRLHCSGPKGGVVQALSVSIRVVGADGSSWSGPVSTIPLEHGEQLVELPAKAMGGGGTSDGIASIELVAKHPAYSEMRVMVDPNSLEASAQFTGSADLELTVSGIPRKRARG